MARGVDRAIAERDRPAAAALPAAVPGTPLLDRVFAPEELPGLRPLAGVIPARGRDPGPQEPVRTVLLDRQHAHILALQADVAEGLELAALAREVDTLHLSRGDGDAHLATDTRGDGDRIEAHALVRWVDEDLDRVGADGDRQLVEP